MNGLGEGFDADASKGARGHVEAKAGLAWLRVQYDWTGQQVGHRTTLYTSIYRFDRAMLVNHHVLGLPAAHAPVMHLRQLDSGDLFATYVEVFERVWAGAQPAWQEAVA